MSVSTDDLENNLKFGRLTIPSMRFAETRVSRALDPRELVGEAPRLELDHVLDRAVEPAVPFVVMEQHRHAVVDRADDMTIQRSDSHGNDPNPPKDKK